MQIRPSRSPARSPVSPCISSRTGAVGSSRWARCRSVRTIRSHSPSRWTRTNSWSRCRSRVAPWPASSCGPQCDSRVLPMQRSRLAWSGNASACARSCRAPTRRRGCGRPPSRARDRDLCGAVTVSNGSTTANWKAAIWARTSPDVEARRCGPRTAALWPWWTTCSTQVARFTSIMARDYSRDTCISTARW